MKRNDGNHYVIYKNGYYIVLVEKGKLIACSEPVPAAQVKEEDLRGEFRPHFIQESMLEAFREKGIIYLEPPYIGDKIEAIMCGDESVVLRDWEYVLLDIKTGLQLVAVRTGLIRPRKERA